MSRQARNSGSSRALNRRLIVNEIRRAGLPTSVQLKPAEIKKLCTAMRLDKKVSGGEVKFVLAKKLGATTVWIDSIANVEELSMSGRHARRHADVWLTQWPHLAQPDGPHYRGGVL